MPEKIVIRGARAHNLRNIDVEIPRDRLTVITGLSGSGKSSLAFETLYAEGQRRYVESLSLYARQVLGKWAKPEVDGIEGLSPAISIEQRGPSRSPRSTVGTMTEVYDHLRLLYAKVGEPFCYNCGRPIIRHTIVRIVDWAFGLEKGTRISVLAPYLREKRTDLQAELAELRRQGFVRIILDGALRDLGESIAVDPQTPHTLDVYVDRLTIRDGVRSRLADSVETATRLAAGLVKIAVVDGEDRLFTERLSCIDCGISYPDLTPRLFSFNSPHGACEACKGLGSLPYVDPDLLVADPKLALGAGAIAPWGARPPAAVRELISALSTHFRFDLQTPWEKLPAAARETVLHGSGREEIAFDYKRGKQRFQYARPVEGLASNLERRYRETESPQVREEADRYVRQRKCETCQGLRLRRECFHIRFGGKNIVELSQESISAARAFLEGVDLDRRSGEIAHPILREATSRLAFVESVGLDYLTLDRASATLSGGEAQRLQLATQLGNALVGVIYVLDEPSAGLHPRDNARLVQTLEGLRDAGNTVIVVEHDEQTIRAADHLIDLGPGAGPKGGRVVAEGPPSVVAESEASLTGQYLSRKRTIAVPARRRDRSGKRLVLRGACGNNLKDVALEVPHGLLTCVSGVSGSGKSSLIIDTLQRALSRKLYRSKDEPLPFATLEGTEGIDRVIDIGQSPIGRTPRSNPATYSGIFGPLRETFVGLPESRQRGWTAGRYSFNVKGGRCEACEGEGVERIEMQFLPDVEVTCEECGGLRYNRETLEVRYRGYHIADVLAMSIDDALDLFAVHRKIAPKLETLRDVGLGYLTLGQSATTLSGGEAQRIKLARELAKRASGDALYILDEPTTGLHPEDVRKLLDVLDRLVEGGNTVLVIEHNLDVLKCADYLVDLGPEGGDGGGRIVADGTPEEVVAQGVGHTAIHLAAVLDPPAPARSPRRRSVR